MNIYQLLLDGTCWVGIAGDTRWVGPFPDYGSAHSWALDPENRTPGQQIRSRGLLRVAPDKWSTPDSELSLSRAVDGWNREGESSDVGPDLDLIAEIASLSVPKMGKRLGELGIIELEMLRKGEARASGIRAIDAALESLRK